MHSVWGKNLQLSIFGEAHGQVAGGTLHGFPAGIRVNMDRIKLGLKLRQGSINFSRIPKEEDRPKILSGVTNGVTNGAPITVVFTNKDKDVQDFNADTPRPSHADYAANARYDGAADMNGGGHFSGRLTLPIVFFGMMAADYLAQKNIEIASHIKCVGETYDDPLPAFPDKQLMDRLNSSPLATVSPEARKRMVSLISGIKALGDSIGGAVETVITGLPAGLGSPIFGGLQSEISSILFAVPAVKSVGFGLAEDFAAARASDVNDAFILKDGKVETATNFNGGLNRGITNGMPVTVTTVYKPTPSIAKPQKTLNTETNRIVDIEIKGRHVPCLLPRASIVTTAAVAVAVLDAVLARDGYAR